MIYASQKAEDVVKKYNLGEKVAFVHELSEDTKSTILDHTSILMVTGYAKDVIKEEKTNPVRGEFFGV